MSGSPENVSGLTVSLPQNLHPSPVDWRQEVIYFLLPDRFNDEKVESDNRTALGEGNDPAEELWPDSWYDWAKSGNDRWQGGTLKGVESKLDYLSDLGVTTIWLGPVFKQRGHLNTYHGYGIQDFLNVDSHFGTRDDLIELVKAAHKINMRVILDVVFNHSGWNWNYDNVDQGDKESEPKYRPWPDYYPNIYWLDEDGNRLSGNPSYPNQGVWPAELHAPEAYTRAGKGNLGGEKLDDVHAEFRRTDFDGAMRDFNFDREATVRDIARCYKYWIALTDCDGFRLDTLKHVDTGIARTFCGILKEFASNLGKTNFFLVGEVGGEDVNAQRYRDVLKSNLNATLDIGSSRLALTAVAKGLAPAATYFDMVAAWDDQLGSHRDAGLHHVVVLDDHDHVFGPKVRFSADASSRIQVVAGIAIQLFSLGIPCIYYGTEQSFKGPPESQRQYLPEYGKSDRYLRETMFGASHSRKGRKAGLGKESNGLDTGGLPGFAAFGAVGYHCFRRDFETFTLIKHLIATRQKNPVLRFGRQYHREIKMEGYSSFSWPKGGDIFAWSRILDEEEAVVVINGHGKSDRGSSASVTVDKDISWRNGFKMRVIGSTVRTYVEGNQLEVKLDHTGRAYLKLDNISASGVVVLSNRS
jgi:glycosidase